MAKSPKQKSQVLSQNTIAASLFGLGCGFFLFGIQAYSNEATRWTVHEPAPEYASHQARIIAPVLDGRSRVTPDPIRRVGHGRYHYEIVADELLVRLSDEASIANLEKVLEPFGSLILSQGRSSGLLQVRCPEGLSLQAFERLLHGVSGIEAVMPNAIAVGAKKPPKNGSTGDVEFGAAPQWNLTQIGLDEALADYNPDLDHQIVAVLDTGVAYASASIDGEEYAQAPGFESIEFLGGYDFINMDEHAYDDHMHGTHITGIIAGEGYSIGVAPGVQILPIKVLDSQMRGTEYALVEGIYYAVESGAHIINMSLSFGLGYYPSSALQEAIAFAAEAGVLMVSSTGNHGSFGVAYPAAFPQVMAVGSGWRESQGNGGKIARSEYSGYGHAIDILAPGGQFDSDWDKNDLPDGIIAAGFEPGVPQNTGHWMVAGTSQAAAHISGAAAWLMADGHGLGELNAEAFAAILREAAYASNSNKVYEEVGAGFLDLPEARDYIEELNKNKLSIEDILPDDYYVNLFAWLEPSDMAGRAQAHIRVSVLDAEGNPAADVEVGGSFFGSLTDFDVLVKTDQHGIAEVISQDIEAEQGVAVGFQVDMVRKSNAWVSSRPTQFYSLSPATAEVLAQLAGAPDLSQSNLLWQLDETDAALWQALDVKTIIPGFSVTPVGPGYTTGPMVIVLDEAFAPELAEADERTALSLHFGGPLLSGRGMIEDVGGYVYEGQIQNLGMAPRHIILKPDTAQFQFDIDHYYPVLNALTANYVEANQTFGDGFASSTLGAGFASSAMGMGFASSSLGDGFAVSSLGAGFASSTLGMGFATSAMGNGFAASSMGMGFASSSLGMGFAVSSMGASVQSSPENEDLVSSTSGCTVYQISEAEMSAQCVQDGP